MKTKTACAMSMVLLSGCAAAGYEQAPEEGTTEPSVASKGAALVVDAAHGGRYPGFYFLGSKFPKPPSGAHTTLPNVTIWIEMKMGPNSLYGTGSFSHYTFQPWETTTTSSSASVQWVASADPYPQDITYRVHAALPDGRELGSADLKIVKNKAELNQVDRTRNYAVIDGEALTISYRVENRAVDADGDRLVDWQDNCWNVANATQADSDGDGIGDPCEKPVPTYPRIVHRLKAGERFDLTANRTDPNLGTLSFSFADGDSAQAQLSVEYGEVAFSSETFENVTLEDVPSLSFAYTSSAAMQGTAVIRLGNQLYKLAQLPEEVVYDDYGMRIYGGDGVSFQSSLLESKPRTFEPLQCNNLDLYMQDWWGCDGADFVWSGRSLDPQNGASLARTFGFYEQVDASLLATTPLSSQPVGDDSYGLTLPGTWLVRSAAGNVFKAELRYHPTYFPDLYYDSSRFELIKANDASQQRFYWACADLDRARQPAVIVGACPADMEVDVQPRWHDELNDYRTELLFSPGVRALALPLPFDSVTRGSFSEASLVEPLGPITLNDATVVLRTSEGRLVKVTLVAQALNRGGGGIGENDAELRWAEL